jgi:hypothetical protein
MFSPMIQGSFFPEPWAAVPDDEVIELLREAIARGGRLSRSAEMLLCGLCAQHLIEALHGAGLACVCPAAGQGR